MYLGNVITEIRVYKGKKNLSYITDTVFLPFNSSHSARICFELSSTAFQAVIAVQGSEGEILSGDE